MTPIPTAALAQHIAILGKTGSGKTTAAKSVIVEPLLAAGKRVAIVDPTSAWWGLRSSADGRGAGFKVLVLGGDHGDLPLPVHGGAAVARLIVEQSVNLVADTGNLTVGERTRWMIDFAGALYRLNRAPLHLVIDEAHVFAPQGKVPDPDTGRMLHAVNQIAAGGRSRGIRLTMLTQRPQKLHKDTLTTADTLIAMRVLAPQDREAVKAWVDGCGDPAQGKEVLDSLAQLQRGEGWVWYPEGGVLHRVRFPAITTFDSSATPKDGDAIAAPRGAAEIDLAEIRAALAEAAQEAADNDPKALRARIAELERQAGKPRELAVDVESLQAEYQRGRYDGYAEAVLKLKTIFEPIRRQVAVIDAAADEMIRSLAEWGEQPTGGESANPLRINPDFIQTDATNVAPVKHPDQFAKLRISAPRASASARGAPAAPEQRILDSLAWWESAGVRQPTRHQVAFVARYTVSGHFNNIVGALRGRGLIEYPGGGNLELTDAGRKLASAPERRPTRDELVQRVDAVLRGEPARRIFGILASAPGPLPREDLAIRAGYTVSGHFNNIVGSLNSIGVAEYPGRGTVALSRIFEALR